MENPTAADVEVAAPVYAYRFGPFELDLKARRLSSEGQEILLSRRIYRLLEVLVQSQGEAVSRDDLIDELWGGTIVSDHSLTEAMSRLRGCLGDASTDPTYIQTIPAYGFRFIAPVEALDAHGRPQSTWPPLWKLALPGVVASGLMLAVALGTIFSTAGPGPTERLILNTITLPDGSPMLDFAAELSPDEQLLAFAQSEPPRLRLMDLRTGQVRTLGELDRVWNGRSLRWSPDSTMLARGDRPQPAGSGRLELFDVATGDRTILAEQAEGFPAVLGWDPAGERMLVWVSGTRRPTMQGGPNEPVDSLRLIDREGRVVAQWLAGPLGGGGRISPDGRWLALSQWGEAGGEIVVVPIADVWSRWERLDQDYFRDWRNGARITDPPCADFAPLWNQTSDKLLFFTFRSGDRELWAVDVSEGRPLGQPRPMQVPGDPYAVQGWAADGSVFFCSLRNYRDLALATLDPASATIVGPPVFLSLWEGSAQMPAWSDDPDRLMFVSRHEDPGGEVYIASFEDVAEGTVVRETNRIGVEGPLRNPAWSADGTRLYYVGGLDAGGQGLFEQNMATGESRRLLPDERVGGNVVTLVVTAGRLLLFNTLGPREGAENTSTLPAGLYLYDLVTEQLRHLDDSPSLPATLSPDGAWVAFTRADEDYFDRGEPIGVELFAVDGGARRTIAVVPAGGWETVASFAFSPDSRTVAYIIRRRPPEGSCHVFELWLADLGGGPPRKVEARDSLNPTRVAWSRTGNRLALSTDDCQATVQFYAPLVAED